MRNNVVAGHVPTVSAAISPNVSGNARAAIRPGKCCSNCLPSYQERSR